MDSHNSIVGVLTSVRDVELAVSGPGVDPTSCAIEKAPTRWSARTSNRSCRSSPGPTSRATLTTMAANTYDKGICPYWGRIRGCSGRGQPLTYCFSGAAVLADC